MPIYIGNQKLGSVIGSSTPSDENLAKDWITGAIDLTDFSQTEINDVTNVKQYGLSGSSSALQAILPNCIHVAAYAFTNSSFQQISLPICENFESNAFSGAYNLQQVYVPNMTFVPTYCFANCYSLLQIDLLKVTQISSYGLSYCESLTTANTPLVEIFNQYCFAGCISLQNVNTSSGIYFYRYAFNGCSSLKSVDFSSAYDIYYQSFYNCTSLEKIWLPSSVYQVRCTGTNSPFVGVNPNCVIYTDMNDESEVPNTWGRYWNNYNSSGKLTVLYGCTHQNFIDGTLPTYPYNLTIVAPTGSTVKIKYMNVEQTTNSITMKEGGVATYVVEKQGCIPYSGTVTMETTDITITVTSDMLVEIPSAININYENASTGDNPEILASLIDNYNFELNANDNSIVNGSKTCLNDEQCESHGYIVVCPKIPSVLSVTTRISSENGWDYGGVYVDNKIYEPSFTEVKNGYNYGTGTYLIRRCGINMTPTTYTMSLQQGVTYYLNFFYVKDAYFDGNDKVYFDSIVVEKEPEIDIFEQVISGQVTYIDNSDITSLPSHALCACSNLTTINLPNLITINSSAISQCYSLTILNIPNVKTIDYFGLELNTLLQVLDLPNVETIYTGGLTNCESLRKVWLSNKCTDLWPEVFKGDTNLTLYTNLTEAPIGWQSGWDVIDDYGTKVNVVWGATHEQFENA